MNQIRKKPKYRVKAPLVGNDYVVGTNSEKEISAFEFEETMSVTLSNIRNFVIEGLSPELGGLLKITELTDNTLDFATPELYINSINPYYSISKYELVIVTHRGNKYILNKQDTNVGVDNLPVISTDFIKLNVDVNIGSGAKLYKGINIYGEKELRTFNKSGDLIDVNEQANEIVYSINESVLKTFITTFQKTYSVGNIGTGVGLYKELEVTSLDTKYKFKSLKAENDSVVITQSVDGNEILFKTKESETKQKLIYTDYTLTAEDNDYSIIVSNGASNVIITVPSGLPKAFFVGITQIGTGEVSFLGSGTTISSATGLKIKGNIYQVGLEQVGITNNYNLLGNTKL